MKRMTILMIAMLLGVASLWARPGYSKPVDVPQPDGTTVTLLMRGDEFRNFITTIDGYTVVKGADGYYRYADKANDGQLTATAVIARNPDVRTAEEQAFLTGRAKMIAPEMTAFQRELKERAATLYAPVSSDNGQRRVTTIWPRINYSNFKGLVILVNFADRSFTLDDPQDFFQKLTSEANYTDASLTHYPVPVEGSARDYFRDNSLGMFDPTFDVVGPVTISKNAAEVGGSNVSNATLASMFKDALNQLNSTVNFSEYDLDNDGYIDICYFIFAGYGSYVQGNNSGYIWPHANNWSGGYSTYMNMPKYDGKSFGRYACSVEIQDLEALAAQHQYLDGIGTICHEFSHVLGLADHYDTDYDEHGTAPTSGAWDVMDGGADHNYGLTPAGYNSFERYQLGFCEPQLLETAGDYALQPFSTGNDAFMVKTKKNNEEFYIENRQQTGWDRFLPSHGLLVWRADTSKPNKWKSNEVNISPDAMYFELLCANGNSVESANAPFPGSGNVMDLTDYSNEAWGSRNAAIDLFDITESGGVITFKAGKNIYDRKIEDFEQSPVTISDATGVQGVFCNWDLENVQIVNVADAGVGNGQHVAKLLRSGTLSSSQAFENGIRTLKFTVKNGSSKVKFVLSISSNGGETWQAVHSSDIKKNEEASYMFPKLPAGCMIRLGMLSTTNSAVCYIDDIEITIPNDETAIQGITATGAAQTDVLYDLQGRRVDANYRGIVIRNGKKMLNK